MFIAARAGFEPAISTLTAWRCTTQLPGKLKTPSCEEALFFIETAKLLALLGVIIVII
jgi:hypothetical protein